MRAGDAARSIEYIGGRCADAGEPAEKWLESGHMASGRTIPRARQRERDGRIAGAIERWFAAHARDLPWRRVGADGRRDAYRSLVSEFMLQQTQVSRVAPAFERFVSRFPDVESLARAPVDEVVRMWEGLGYYRRARLVHGAAAAVVSEHGGRVPESVEGLRTIPGVGAYTAGSIASIVFGARAAVVDANVRRVLVRIEGREVEESPAAQDAWAWGRAESLVGAAHDPGVLNEGLMELGALVCVPRSPRCEVCPVRGSCVARRKGLQHSLPRPALRARRTAIVHQVVVIRDRARRVLVEQRPREGMWGGLWQIFSRESRAPGLCAAELCAWAGVRRVESVGTMDRMTTHRAVRFEVFRAVGGGVKGRRLRAGERWFDPREAGEVAFSVPQRLILERYVLGTGEGRKSGG